MTSTAPGAVFGFAEAAPTCDTPALVGLGIPTREYVGAVADMVGDLLPGAQRVEAHVLRDARVEFARTDAAHRVRLSGGVIELEVKWPRPMDAAEAREWRSTAKTRTAQRVLDLFPGEDAEPEEVWHRGMITHWSKRSRRNMLHRLAQIDHDTWERPDWRLSMITLTLPGDWLTVCPDGRAWKRAFERFRVRWLRQFGWWQVAWKQEFQERGAPHMHLMTRVPDRSWRSKREEPFRRWLSRVWAECVRAEGVERINHELAGTNVDYGFTGTDPKRIAVYFLKHSTKTHDGKEYQHIVPPEWREAEEGPGRFWGIAGLGRLDELIDLDERAWDLLKRALRHWHRAHRARVALARRAHAVAGVSEATRRATLLDLRTFGAGRDRVLADPLGGGWVLVNDAPALLYDLARWIASRE